MDYKRNLIGRIIWPAFYNFCLADKYLLKGDAVKLGMFISIIYLLKCCRGILSMSYCSKRGTTSQALIVVTDMHIYKPVKDALMTIQAWREQKRGLQNFHSSLSHQEPKFLFFCFDNWTGDIRKILSRDVGRPMHATRAIITSCVRARCVIMWIA